MRKGFALLAVVLIAVAASEPYYPKDGSAFFRVYDKKGMPTTPGWTRYKNAHSLYGGEYHERALAWLYEHCHPEEAPADCVSAILDMSDEELTVKYIYSQQPHCIFHYDCTRGAAYELDKRFKRRVSVLARKRMAALLRGETEDEDITHPTWSPETEQELSGHYRDFEEKLRFNIVRQTTLTAVASTAGSLNGSRSR